MSTGESSAASPDVEANRAEARKLMQKAGYGPDKHLAVKVSTRNIPVYRDPAVILIDQLKSIYIDAELDVVDSVVRMFVDPVLELDSQMLADSVRVVVRTLERAKKVLIQPSAPLPLNFWATMPSPPGSCQPLP